MIIVALNFLVLQGRKVLMTGLALGILTGLVVPDIADVLQVIIAPVVITLLFLAVLRLGPEGVRAGLAGWRGGVVTVIALQLLMPVLAIAGLLAFGLHGAWALGIVLVLAASPITGSPNLAIMSGASASTALRQLVLGTILLPVTTLPVFLLMPDLGAPNDVAIVVLRLLAVIAFAGFLGLWLRARGIVTASTRSLTVIDGCSTLLLAVIVIALMGAVGPALVAGIQAWGLLLLVMALGFGLQIVTLLAARGKMPQAEAAAVGQAAGNRNIALFLGVLPPAVATDLLLFVGLYQIPMYLTPLIMGWIYARLGLKL